MKNVAILYSTYSPTIDAIKYQLEDIAQIEVLSSVDKIYSENFDLVILSNYNGECNINAINIHHSLLPAFNTRNPVKDAIMEGVKITGLTVFYTNPYKIITQYPVFIYNDAHYDELKQELIYLEQTIYPIVIEKILKNEPFEIRALMSQKDRCAGDCKECTKCRN